MPHTMFRLDFDRGIVEEIDDRMPPGGTVRDDTEPERLPEGAGYVLAALGTPPAEDEE